MAMRSNHTHISVAQAQPTPPSRGKPRLPKTSSQLTSAFNTSATRAITIIGLVWFKLAL